MWLALVHDARDGDEFAVTLDSDGRPWLEACRSGDVYGGRAFAAAAAPGIRARAKQAVRGLFGGGESGKPAQFRVLVAYHASQAITIAPSAGHEAFSEEGFAPCREIGPRQIARAVGRYAIVIDGDDDDGDATEAVGADGDFIPGRMARLTKPVNVNGYGAFVSASFPVSAFPKRFAVSIACRNDNYIFVGVSDANGEIENQNSKKLFGLVSGSGNAQTLNGSAHTPATKAAGEVIKGDSVAFAIVDGRVSLAVARTGATHSFAVPKAVRHVRVFVVAEQNASLAVEA